MLSGAKRKKPFFAYFTTFVAISMISETHPPSKSEIFFQLLFVLCKSSHLLAVGDVFFGWKKNEHNSSRDCGKISQIKKIPSSQLQRKSKKASSKVFLSLAPQTRKSWNFQFIKKGREAEKHIFMSMMWPKREMENLGKKVGRKYFCHVKRFFYPFKQHIFGVVGGWGLPVRANISSAFTFSVPTLPHHNISSCINNTELLEVKAEKNYTLLVYWRSIADMLNIEGGLRRKAKTRPKLIHEQLSFGLIRLVIRITT